MTKTGRKLPRYSESFKKLLVKKVVEGEASCLIISRQYGVSSMSLYRWLDRYGLEFSVNFDSKEEESKKNNVSTNQKKGKDWCTKRIEELEEEVRMEKLRRLAYEQLIKIAEERFEISIEKKYGTKQSRK